MAILQARILEWVARPSSGGSPPTQGSNPGLPHCRGILYQLSHKDPLIETMIKMFRKEVLALASEILHITLWIHQTDVDRGLCITSLHDVATHFMKTAG